MEILAKATASAVDTTGAERSDRSKRISITECASLHWGESRLDCSRRRPSQLRCPMSDSHATPPSESERLVALRRAELLDTPPEEVFDRLTQLASELLHVPVAVVSLVDADREFFKSAVGLPTEWSKRREAPRTMSLAETAMLAKAPLAIEDAREHPLVKNNPIIPEWGVVSYAGVPLQTKDGHAIGSVYVADRVPRAWTEQELAALTTIAIAAE